MVDQALEIGGGVAERFDWLLARCRHRTPRLSGGGSNKKKATNELAAFFEWFLSPLLLKHVLLSLAVGLEGGARRLDRRIEVLHCVSAFLTNAVTELETLYLSNRAHVHPTLVRAAARGARRRNNSTGILVLGRFGFRVLDNILDQSMRPLFGILLSDIAFENGPEECAKEIKSEIKNTNVEIFAFKADASSFEDAQATVDEAVNKMGGVDILVNNAGITRDNLLLRMSEKEFDDVIAINLKSVFNYTKAALRPMIKQRSGRIINMASVVGLIGNAGQSNYVAYKAGVIGFTKAMEREIS